MYKNYRFNGRKRPSLSIKWAFLPLMLAAPLMASGQNTKSLYMSVVFNNARRTPIETELPTVKSGQRGPVIDFTTEHVRVDGRSLAFSSIKGISFEAKVSTGIEAPTKVAEDDKNVYALDGRLVRRGTTSLDGLKKGIYIVNGKKLIIK